MQILYLSPKLLCLALLVLLANSVKTQSAPAPKLVVGITVDQMRWDYLKRFEHRFAPNGGFKRMVQQGFSCDNTYIGYAPTVTAAGHAGIFTGSVPAIHGITGNEWWDVNLKDLMYCTEDKKVKGVGSNSAAGLMSPVNLLTTTISDELKLATNMRAKTIGIAIKDRGAILPAGHSANGAYWYDAKEGAFITSTYYMQQLPDWATQFKTRDLIDSLYKINWVTSFPADTYTQSNQLRKAYELRTFGSGTRAFPYQLAEYAGLNYSIISATPQGNTMTIEFAKAALLGEQLGKDSITDLLAVSFSSTDYIGHSFGPNSMEVEDAYLKLDVELGSFFDFLDKEVGEGSYLVFLSADHGAAHVPGFMKENNMPAGLLNDQKLKESLNNVIKEKFGSEGLVLGIVNNQVVLDIAAFENNRRLNYAAVQEMIVQWLELQPEIARAFVLKDLMTTTLPAAIKTRIANGYLPGRSGHIQIILKPGYIDGFLNGGTTHGSWNPYDTHIPLLWYGWKIPKGSSTNTYTEMADIAPTLAALLQIQEPNGSVGKVIEAIFK